MTTYSIILDHFHYISGLDHILHGYSLSLSKSDTDCPARRS